MQFARSKYLGGQIIQAGDERLDYLSYEKLGLRCYYCGEPVLYKNGAIRESHFAHFPDIHPDRMEECELRQKNQSLNS